jgi:hypothetical protein
MPQPNVQKDALHRHADSSVHEVVYVISLAWFRTTLTILRSGYASVQAEPLNFGQHGRQYYIQYRQSMIVVAFMDGISLRITRDHQKGRDTRKNIYRDFFGMPPTERLPALRYMRHADKFGAPPTRSR